MNTVEATRESLISSVDQPKDYEHLIRLKNHCWHMHFPEVERWERQIDAKRELLPFINDGFRLITDEQKMCRFRYAAAIDSYGFSTTQTLWGGQIDQTYGCVHDAHNNAILYTGDIPEFALDRIEKAQEIKSTLNRGRSQGMYFPDITIHSLSPLPFVITKPRITYLRKIDPVLVFWLHRPDFLFSWGKVSSQGNHLGIY